MRLPPTRHLPRLVLSGLCLGLAEIVVVMVFEIGAFLSATELARYGLLALSAGAVLAVVAGTLGLAWLGMLGVGLGRDTPTDSPRLARRVGLSAFAIGTLATTTWLWILTEGRRARALPARPLLVIACGLLLGWLVSQLARQLLRASPRQARLVGFGLWGVVLLALALDSQVLPRLYPAFHLGLSLCAVAAASCAGFLIRPSGPRRLSDRLASGGVALALALSALSLWWLADAPNLRFAIERSAPISGKLLALTPRPRVPDRHAAARTGSDEQAPASAQDVGRLPGLDLSGQDILLITVDALRADRLKAYGGRGLTPEMDELAERSVVFRRAYTPTPHTSYALASMLTGKFIRPLSMLSEAPREHPTLPRMLRRYGYRTGAFYPPAIFFVDQERFRWLVQDQLGFEYVKAMYASADERVEQLASYLASVDDEHPVFVWVHLFEPHEPYEPPPGLATGDEPSERYDGEVVAVDRAVGRMLELFRRERGEESTIVLSADHGEEFGDHGGYYHGTTLFDEQARVPLLWSSPEVSPRAVSVPVETVDIATTLLSALGVPRDVRMRGDDLSPTLTGSPQQLHAFSSIDGLRMVTDGRFKAICRSEDACSLYELTRDPRELDDVALENPRVVARLHSVLAEFVASIPKMEALSLGDDGGWPAALARARLGDPTAKADVLPLLGARRPEVRAAAARAVGELGIGAGANLVSRLSRQDPVPEVRAEASLAVALLMAREGAFERADSSAATFERLRDLLAEESLPREIRRRSARALAERGDAAGSELLLRAAADRALDERERASSLEALAGIADRLDVERLVPLLHEVRLRPKVAALLGKSGDPRAAAALTRQLEHEPYPAARAAEVRALLELGHERTAVRFLWRFLGTESSLPGAVSLLEQAGALSPPSGRGAVLAPAASQRIGAWACVRGGCQPLSDAAIRLPAAGAPRGSCRVRLRVSASDGAQRLSIAGHRFGLEAGQSEVSFRTEHAPSSQFSVEASDGVRLHAIAVAPAQPEPAKQGE